MANNRMFLLHRPTGLAISLGKHMGTGWYSPPTNEQLQDFYDEIETVCGGGPSEDFILGMESCDAGTPFVMEAGTYGAGEPGYWEYTGSAMASHRWQLKVNSGGGPRPENKAGSDG